MSTIAVAKEAGVSPATVSRVLNHRPGVSTEKTQRVMKAIEKLGYRPSTTVQRRQGPPNGIKHGNIALVILSGDMLQEYSSVFHKSLKGVEETLGEHHLNIVKARVNSCDQLPPMVTSNQIDGLILAGDTDDKELLRELKRFPRSWITSRDNNRSDAVLAGNEQIGRIAAEYLIERGHRELAALHALAWHSSSSTRIDFFEYTATRAGASVLRLLANAPGEYLSSSSLDLELLEHHIEPQINKLLAAEKQPTGLFVPMDYQAAMVYRVLIKRGIQPGRDIDVIGCDNEAPALIGLYPRPATINIDGAAIGRRAVEQLLWRIAHPGETARMHVVVEPQLIPGENYISN